MTSEGTRSFEPNGTQVLDLPLETEKDSGEPTIRAYLVRLVREVWREGEGFDGKRPFGNSGWQWDLMPPLIKAEYITGTFDEDGYLDEFDEDRGNELILKAIDALGTAAPVAAAVVPEPIGGDEELARLLDLVAHSLTRSERVRAAVRVKELFAARPSPEPGVLVLPAYRFGDERSWDKFDWRALASIAATGYLDVDQTASYVFGLIADAVEAGK